MCGGLQMSDSVLGPFSFFRPAEPNPSLRIVLVCDHGGCWLPPGQADQVREGCMW